ncbi:MAG: hypothetical protein WCL32_07820 [Planctomycetota bacterium]
MSDSIPNESWSLERLITFARSKWRRMAQDAWYLGKALAIAQAKVGYGKWIKWLQKNLPEVNYPMVHRYMALAKRIANPAELEGMKICEALNAVGITTDGGRSKVKKATEPALLVPVVSQSVVLPEPDGKPGSEAGVIPPVVPPVTPASLKMPDVPPLSFHVRAILSTDCREHDLSRAEIGKAIKVLQALLRQKAKATKRKAG